MSESTPSPVSDGSSSTEGTVLRDFVDQAIAEKRLPTLSPRDAILSQSSLKSPAPDERSSAIASGAVGSGRQVRKRSNGSRRSQRMEVGRPSTLAQLMDVDLSRKDPKDEVMRLREILKTVERHSAMEVLRVKELERANLEAERRVQVFAETQLREKQEALKAQQEVRLVNLQLQNAQEELERKQREVKRIEQQRDEAEADAARAREKARKFREQTIAAAAREEGRRLGFKAGFDYASQERQMITKKPVRHRGKSSRSADAVGPRGAAHGDENRWKSGEQPKQPTSGPSSQRRRDPNPPLFDPHPPDITSDNGLSPSLLPLRSLSVVEPYPEQDPAVTAGPFHSTPLRSYVPPPEESDAYGRHAVEPSTSNQYLWPPDEPPPQTKSPAISIFEVDIPPAEELNRQYSNSQENSSDAIHQGSRDQWVTASSFHERRGRRAPPGAQAPPQPALQPRPRPTLNTQPSASKVKFTNILSRPSLLKTKEQATSWYRTLSWRKKSKVVIDTIPEEGPPTSSGPISAPIYDSQPPTATDPPDTTDSRDAYNRPVVPPESWYQPPNQQTMNPGVASSMRSVSTRVSAFALLATPHPPAMSMRSGREGSQKAKEKELYLRAITENLASRRNNPTALGERAAHASENMQSMASVLWHPSNERRPLQQEPSYATFDSSSQNKRPSRRPPTISVPDYDQKLEPYGVAFNRGATANGYPPHAGADLNRRPSRISEKTTPDTSIAIDVVPPSGFAPDPVQSPPHTGENHLSPYHTYHAAAPLFKQSIQSLRNQGSPRPQFSASQQQRPPSSAAATSRKQSQQSFSAFADPPQAWGRYTPGPSPSPRNNNVPPVRPPSAAPTFAAASRPASGMSRPASQRTTQTQQYAGPAADYAASVRSSATAARHAEHPLASQVSLSNLTGTGGVLGQSRNASATRLVLASPVHRVASNASMRSQGSYARFDPGQYVDPAMWTVDGVPPAPSPHEGVDYFDREVPPRAVSVNSGLSYITDPNEKY